MLRPVNADENTPAANTGRLHDSSMVRMVLYACGVVALILGAIGVVLPGLPTTPFVLIAGACFVRASPRAHAWLLKNRTFGPILREWEQHRSIPRRVKRIGLIMMALTGAASLWFLAGKPWLQAMVVAGLITGTATVLYFPSRD